MTEKTRGERRADTARRNDDSDIIEDSERIEGQQGRSGGDLQRDVGTKARAEKVQNPGAHGSREKEDEISHGEFVPGRRSATEVVSERKR